MKLLVLLFVLASRITTAMTQDISADRIDSLILHLKVTVNEHFISIDKAQLLSDSLHGSPFRGIINRVEFIKALNRRLYEQHQLSIQHLPRFS